MPHTDHTRIAAGSATENPAIQTVGAACAVASAPKSQAVENAKNIVCGLGHLAHSAVMVAQAAVTTGGIAAREVSAGPMQAAVKASNTKAGAVTEMAAGTAIAAAGVPMLILPGPGVAAIAGGVALASDGARKAFGMKKRPEKPRSK